MGTVQVNGKGVPVTTQSGEI